MQQRFFSIGAGVLVSSVVCFCSLPSANLKNHPKSETGSSRKWTHPFDLPQSDLFPDELVVVIEIPQGSITKYEIDPVSGIVAVDRFQSMPVTYPTNYGVITSSLAGDGDNLDVLLLSREPIVPGAMVKARPVGVLRMLDGGDEDDKVIAVPTSKIDPTYDAIHDISDLPAVEVQRIEAFFRVYKQLPAGRKLVELKGFLGIDEAKSLIRQASERFQSQKQH
jgi:inorganic pyrophosphatase